MTDDDSALVDPLHALLGYQLRRASATAMSDLARKLSPIDLRPSEASILLVIGHNEGIVQSELGRLLGIASGNLAPMISRLEKRRLIQRQHADGRSLSLSLSASGQRTAQRALNAMHDHEAQLLSRIPQELHTAFGRGLSALLHGE